jgi:predicted phage gp36 major capsid-like protein
LQKYERRGFRFDILSRLPLWTTPLAKMYLIKVRNLRNDIAELRTDFERKVRSLKRTLKKQKSKIERLTIRQENQKNSTTQQNSARDS